MNSTHYHYYSSNLDSQAFSLNIVLDGLGVGRIIIICHLFVGLVKGPTCTGPRMTDNYNEIRLGTVRTRYARRYAVDVVNSHTFHLILIFLICVNHLFWARRAGQRPLPVKGSQNWSDTQIYENKSLSMTTVVGPDCRSDN